MIFGNFLGGFVLYESPLFSTLESVSGVVSDAYEDVEAFGGKVSDLLSPDPAAATVKEVFDSIKGVPGATYLTNL